MFVYWYRQRLRWSSFRCVLSTVSPDNLEKVQGSPRENSRGKPAGFHENWDLFPFTREYRSRGPTLAVPKDILISHSHANRSRVNSDFPFPSKRMSCFRGDGRCVCAGYVADFLPKRSTLLNASVASSWLLAVKVGVWKKCSLLSWCSVQTRAMKCLQPTSKRI